MGNTRASFYKQYITWKNWDKNVTKDFANDAYLYELKNLNIDKNVRILEIGFGSGGFLDWAKDKGNDVVGVEIIEPLVDSAKERGHIVYHGHPDKLLSKYKGTFELICLFDVLEHISIDELPHLFKTISMLLIDGGKVFARFPNGASPFGRFYQYRDVTHVSVLSPEIINQISSHYDIHLDSSKNSYRPTKAGNVSSFKKRMGYVLRDVIEIIISYSYYGKRVPLDPNISCVLVKENKTK